MASRLAASKRTLARNVLLNWAALIAEVAVAFFLTPFMVRSLGLAIYGIWSLLNSVIGYMGLVDLGIRGSVGRFLNAAPIWPGETMTAGCITSDAGRRSSFSYCSLS